MKKNKTIFILVCRHIAEVFNPFFVFYAVSFLLSLFFTSWKMFFYWPAFHISFILFVVLSFFGGRFDSIIHHFGLLMSAFKDSVLFDKKNINLLYKDLSLVKLHNFKQVEIGVFDFVGRVLSQAQVSSDKVIRKSFYGFKLHYAVFKKYVYFLGNIIGFVFKLFFVFFKILFFVGKRQIEEFYQILSKKIQLLKRREWIKISIIVLVLSFALYWDMGVLDFFVLLYGSFAILFSFSDKISSMIALILLTLCPFLLIFKNNILAENIAIYVYYFLVIAVVAQIKVLLQEKNLSTSKL